MFSKKALIVGLVTAVAMLALLEIIRSYAGSPVVLMEPDAADAVPSTQVDAVPSTQADVVPSTQADVVPSTQADAVPSTPTNNTVD